MVLPLPHPSDIAYPESDGKPIADNTLQFEWIVRIKGSLDVVFRKESNVFVAGDLLWYPVEGRPDIATAPDVLVAFGRPKGHRRSYLQWREGGVPPHVVFEILSPNNAPAEMRRKFEFYQRYGVEEYYLYDPDRDLVSGWRRDGPLLVEVPEIDGWVSPRLGVRFDLSGETLAIFGPDGRRFARQVELVRQNEVLAEQNQALAEQNQALARERDADRDRLEQLAARLRELGVDPEA